MSPLPFGPSARHPSSFILALPVSIAFRRFGPLALVALIEKHFPKAQSPLPFGVLAPWLDTADMNATISKETSPLPFGVLAPWL